jgi:hypothetical protein
LFVTKSSKSLLFKKSIQILSRPSTTSGWRTQKS